MEGLKVARTTGNIYGIVWGQEVIAKLVNRTVEHRFRIPVDGKCVSSQRTDIYSP